MVAVMQTSLAGFIRRPQADQANRRQPNEWQILAPAWNPVGHAGRGPLNRRRNSHSDHRWAAPAHYCKIAGIPPSLALSLRRNGSESPMPEMKLSEREAACLQWAAAGKTSRETAMILGVSERTVNFHLQNACRKLCARNRRAAVATALTSGLLAACRVGGGH
jgi:DNA-binding CsgD family transcriptional regulator